MESVLILCENGPFGTNSGMEAIRLGAGYVALGEDLDCKLVFYGAGVLNLLKNLDPDQIGIDSMDEGIEMADLSELPIVLAKEDLEQFGYTSDDLIEYESLEIVSRADLPGILKEFAMIFRM